MIQNLSDKLTYSEDDWHVMEDAHIKACEILGLHPAYYEHKDRLARTIMSLFNKGTRDYQIIASLAAHRETIYQRVIEMPDNLMRKLECPTCGTFYLRRPYNVQNHTLIQCKSCARVLARWSELEAEFT
ncbi:hypothetical protein [Phyllobacterium sophorae]|uniref:Uncharacterized protein n=1 Tax=Phyllobacterium sophorae TaxID=1520277 RepID=A0A2P7B555_9HYPH|nr:hypothetical protein [Phyllobacterium sophorae]PSH61595.1 hypothetical protein CU103_22570 [Phyllobacterium sophorae]